MALLPAWWPAQAPAASRRGTSDVDHGDAGRIVVLNALTAVGLVFLTVYGVQTLRSGNHVLGSIDLAGAFILVCATVYVRLSRDYATGSHLFVFIIGSFFLFLVVSGGIRNTGPLWVFPFPLVSVYLLGPRGGAVATTLFLVATVTFFAADFPVSADRYSPEFKQRFVFSFLNVCIFAYLHERTTAAFHDRAVARNAQLQRALLSLESAQEQLRQAQKMEAIGQLASGVAHNFNNALQAILANLESLQPRSGREAAALRTAAEAADMAAGIATHLNLLARPEGSAERRPLQIAEIARKAIAMGRGLFDRSVAIVAALDEGLPLVSGNANQLQQALLNLLLNARDAVDQGGVASPRIEVRAAACTRDDAGPCVRISVSDNGVGMDDQTRARVFEPFYTTKGAGRGTGLGLSTVYGIAAAHAGSVECESVLGQGSVFSITIPVSAPTAPEPTPPAAERGGAAAARVHKVLIIEDEDGVREPLAHALRERGYEVLVGRDGREGWEIFERERAEVAVVLLDLSMPRVSGARVLDRIRAAGTDAKVIVTTGFDRREYGSLEADGWLPKPYRLSEAIAAADRVLGRGPGPVTRRQEGPGPAAGR